METKTVKTPSDGLKLFQSLRAKRHGSGFISKLLRHSHTTCHTPYRGFNPSEGKTPRFALKNLLTSYIFHLPSYFLHLTSYFLHLPSYIRTVVFTVFPMTVCKPLEEAEMGGGNFYLEACLQGKISGSHQMRAESTHILLWGFLRFLLIE